MHYQSHPWHSVTPGNNAPACVKCIIEIPKVSNGKYEMNKESGLLQLDRVLFSAVHYPANYGFIPQTYADDNDPLDVLVICSIDVFPMCIVEAKVIGVMEMIDGKEKDEKIIAIAKNDMSVNHINELTQLPPHTLVELKRFFEDYKKLENKVAVVEDFLGKKVAMKIILDSFSLYQDKIKPLLTGSPQLK